MSHRIVRPRIDVPLESVLDVLSRQQSAVGAREHDVGAVGHHRDVTALAAASIVPVADVDAASFSAGSAQGGIVLLGATDTIRKEIGGSDVIKLRGCLILLRPRAPAIE